MPREVRPDGYELVGTVHAMPEGATWLGDDAGMAWPLPPLFRELEGQHVQILAWVVP